MRRKIRYIPTLQEYMKKRKRQQAKFLEINNCKDCDFFRKDNDVCLWGDNIKILTILKTCPITDRKL